MDFIQNSQFQEENPDADTAQGGFSEEKVTYWMVITKQRGTQNNLKCLKVQVQQTPTKVKKE